MAKNFKLQTVLNHRQRLEGLAQQRLADSLRRESAVGQQVVGQRAELQKLQQELSTRQQSGITAHDLQLFRLSINRQNKRLQELMEQAEGLHREVADNRRQLTETAMDKKLLENLKDKKEAEQRYLDNRQEMADLDDIALRLGKKPL